MVRYITLVALILLLVGCNVDKVGCMSDDDVVADTITYLVYITPQNPYDEVEVGYTERLQKEKLVDALFESVYKHRAKVTDYVDKRVLTVDDVKSMEVEDSRYYRDRISVLQFTEEWKYNATTMHFEKKVISVHVGYEAHRDADSLIVANYPGFVIEMVN